MDKIEMFLDAQQRELELERNQIQDDIGRTKKQMDELREKIAKREESKDRSYEVLRACQTDPVADTEISAMEQLISEKSEVVGLLQNQLTEVEKKLAQLDDLDYHSSQRSFGCCASDLIVKLQRIYKWIPVDGHRAQEELSKIIKHLEE